MIRLNDTYGIEVDDLSYTLVKISINKSGKHIGEESKKPLGYYRTLVQALESFCRKTTSDELQKGDMTLTEALKRIQKTNEELRRTINAAVPEVSVK